MPADVQILYREALKRVVVLGNLFGPHFSNFFWPHPVVWQLDLAPPLSCLFFSSMPLLTGAGGARTSYSSGAQTSSQDHVVAVRGEPSFTTGAGPVTFNGEEGWRARMSAVWFIGNVNHGFHLDWYGHKRGVVQSWAHRGRVNRFEMWVEQLTAEDVTAAIEAVGLLPRGDS